MSPEPRLRGSVRRAAIVEAAMPLFAHQGFHGVSVREIAAAAGISEALLYRHFSGKEALYEAIHEHCMTGAQQQAEHIAQLAPSTKTLVLAVYLVANSIVGGAGGDNIPRLMLNSLLADGAFARTFLKKTFQRWFPKLRECMAAARAAGELTGPDEGDEVALWLVHHVCAMTRCMRLPDKPAVPYAGKPALVGRVARFALRGLGLTDKALARHFDERALAAFFERQTGESS